MAPSPINDQPRWLSVLQVLGVSAFSVLLSAILTFAIITYAYAFSDHQIGSYDQLYMLGSGPANALAWAWIPGLSGSGLGLVLLLTPADRYAWFLPMGGLVLDVGLAFFYCTTFQQPPPMGG